MKKNDIFTFTAPNGAEVTGVAIEVIGWYHETDDAWQREYLCYAQNKLFRGTEDYISYHVNEISLDLNSLVLVTLYKDSQTIYRIKLG